MTPKKYLFKVLVACEKSGLIREAFKRRGVYALSCDLQETEISGNHYKGSIFDVLYNGWDLMIAHPPCTYLCNSGVRWLHTEPGRFKKMEEGAEFFNRLKNAPIFYKLLENPVPHKYAVEKIGKYDQLVQPYQFGHGETKATCLWLDNLPKLKYTQIVTGREAKVHKCPPGPERANIRSKTYSGIAEAIAEQYTQYLKNPYLQKQLSLF